MGEGGRDDGGGGARPIILRIQHTFLPYQQRTREREKERGVTSLNPERVRRRRKSLQERMQMREQLQI